jgi:general secretion pathway protein D
MNKKILIVLMLLFSILITSNLYGQELKSTARATKVTAESIAFQKKLAAKKYPYELDFKGTSLSDALSIISKTSNVSIVAAAAVADKKIDLYLPKGQSLKKIIDTIKTTNGLVEKIQNDTLILSYGGDDEGPVTPLTGKVVGKVTEVDKITGIKGVTLSLSDDPNTLVLSDVGGAFIIDDVMPGTYILKGTKKGHMPSGEIVEVKPGETTSIQVVLTKREDRLLRPEEKSKSPGQVVQANGDISDTKMIELLYSSPNEVKDIVSEIVELNNIVVDEKLNTLILVGTEDNIKTATNLIEQLDVPQKQVRIKARIYDLSNEISRNVGMEWSAQTQDGDYEFDGLGTFGADTGLDLVFGDFTNNTLKFTLSMLERTGDADIQAEPSVVTLNGEEADLKVVTEEIVGTEKEEESDGTTTEKPLFKEAGIVLTVKPVIKSDETIIVDVYAKLSKFVSTGSYSEAGEVKSEMKTTIRIKSGESVVIGGLKRIDTTHSVSKTPLLGDIPLLKALFSSDQDQQTQRDLFIEITPEIIDINPAMAEDIAVTE